MKGILILARHQESEWNKVGRWTGSRDRHLTAFGFKKSEDIGLLIKDISIEYAFASMQVRSIETLSCILTTCMITHIPVEHSAALNERDYGDYTGNNKWEMERKLGPVLFKEIRRGWDTPIPHGESLKAVYDRVVPYFISHILPKVQEGKNVLVVAHGNSLRTLIKYIESISDEAIADLEMPFESVLLYHVDSLGKMIDKNTREVQRMIPSVSRAQIIATFGPACSSVASIKDMINHQLDAVRLNFSYGTLAEHEKNIATIRTASHLAGRHVPIIIDLPGPRIQEGKTHGYDDQSLSAITPQDEEYIAFAVAQRVEYIAVSFVGSVEDITRCRALINQHHGSQKIIAKIERAVAVDHISEIITATDAVMVARGDLGNEIPLEQIPYVQEKIVSLAQDASCPVIVATQMLLSMVKNPEPTRAEVTDVTTAIIQGADAVMLSEETAIGEYPVETVAMMETIVKEAEQHRDSVQYAIHQL